MKFYVVVVKGKDAEQAIREMIANIQYDKLDANVVTLEFKGKEKK
jgi:hypothetical protein